MFINFMQILCLATLAGVENQMSFLNENLDKKILMLLLYLSGKKCNSSSSVFKKVVNLGGQN